MLLKVRRVYKVKELTTMRLQQQQQQQRWTITKARDLIKRELLENANEYGQRGT